MCFKNAPTVMPDAAIRAQGADRLLEYREAGVILQDAGSGLFSKSGAQAILPDGTETQIFKHDSNAVEKQTLLAYLDANHGDLLDDNKGEDGLGVDQTNVTKNEDGDIIVSVSTAGGQEGTEIFTNAQLQTLNELNAAIAALQLELEGIQGAQAAAAEAQAAALAQAKSEREAALAALAAAEKTFVTASEATSFTGVDALSGGEATRLNPDIITLNPAAPVGVTSVDFETIAEQSPDEAVVFQERIAREELRRARVDRAIQKRSLMRRRLEAASQVGAGRIVRGDLEVDLDIGEPSAPITAATGMRGGRGRGSLITGSRGGIGFYSRFS